MNRREVLIGFAVGVVVGGAFGLMYAPRPGAETRTGVGEKVQALKEAAAERARNLPAVIFMPISISISTSR